MKANVGGLDKELRIAAGLIIIAAGAFFQSWWGSRRDYSSGNSAD
ncbi:hypothetical protein BJAS_P1915 [Bathymodiolus japonicus methanotrophic gill symbiont]|nr:hypothetical protein BJAS_P1915 [Bathymodiolus japonicus methanotrophic gill symbiont]